MENFIYRDGILVSPANKSISYPDSDYDICYRLEDNSFWFKHRNNIITEVVNRYSPRSFADVGGGNGYTAKALQDKGIETILIEPGLKGCLNAKERGVKNIICSTLEDAPLKEPVEALGFFDVIEHVERDYELLINAKKFLTENGLVFITVPAFNFLWSEDDNVAGHYRRYTVKKLSALMKKAGYKIEYATYFFSILPLPVFIARTIPSLLGLNKNSHSEERYSDQHKEGTATKILNKIWHWELNKIKSGHAIPFGGSCLVVARKV